MIMPNDNKIGEIGDIRLKKCIIFIMTFSLRVIYFPTILDGEILPYD